MITTTFVRKYENLVKGIAGEYENDSQKREDLIQEIWLEICKSAEILPKDEQAYSTWVHAIATRTCKRHAKGEANEPEMVLDSSLVPTVDGEAVDGSWIEQSVASPYFDPEDETVLAELVFKGATLSEQEAAIFNLVYWHGHSPAYVANKLDIAESTVRTVTERIRAKFEVKEMHHPVHVYHAPGNVWGDWSWKPEKKNNDSTKRNGNSLTS